MSDTKLRSYIDRILRSRAREDDEKANTKEIYKELAGDGYDKTVVGKVVNHLRKDDTKAREESEKFDLYLTAYLGASHVHAREANETPMSHASGQPGGDDPETTDDAASAGEDGELIHEPQAAMPAQTGGIISAPSTVAGPVAVESPATHSEAADLATVSVAETALVPRGAVASEPIADISKPNPICRDPKDCGVYASWHLTCEACKRAAAHRVAA